MSGAEFRVLWVVGSVFVAVGLYGVASALWVRAAKSKPSSRGGR